MIRNLLQNIGIIFYATHLVNFKYRINHCTYQPNHLLIGKIRFLDCRSLTFLRRWTANQTHDPVYIYLRQKLMTVLFLEIQVYYLEFVMKSSCSNEAEQARTPLELKEC